MITISEELDDFITAMCKEINVTKSCLVEQSLTTFIQATDHILKKRLERNRKFN